MAPLDSLACELVETHVATVQVVGSLAAAYGYPVPSEARRWCEKSPANVFFFQAILEHFAGRVRLIQIVRDGRDVVSSMHPRNPSMPWVPTDRWIAAVSAGLPFRNHPGVLTIRYEDLVRDFDRTARCICDFLEEELPVEMLD